MALFRCASGSSGGGATITVTYSSDFYGETVTCSHGTKTYSKVATSSGTLEFSVDEEGTWTISCTIGSDTFSTTADVDLSYDAELVSLPNGETVLPTDDIETWLACAAITDKAYTTLSQVLGDSETYNALLGDSNACAYMKRSTTWTTDICADQYAMNLLGQYDTACDALLSDSTWTTAICNSTYWESVLQPLVPVMTSNTTPSGTCGCQPEPYDSRYPAYKAFDGDFSTFSQTKDSSPRRIYYQFPDTVNVYKCVFTPLNNYLQTRTFQYSDDGSSWSDIDSITPVAGKNEINASLSIGKHAYWGLSQGTSYNTTTEIQFYGRTSSSEKIHGGNPTYDSFYRIVDGNNVPVTDPSLLDAGTYTIYSNGLAKDPSNLSNDYGKTIRICPNTKEIVDRPDNALYWWGYKSANIEDCTTANGWSSVSGTPTYNTADIEIRSASTSLKNAISTKQAVSGDYYALISGVSKASSDYGYVWTCTNKSWGSLAVSASITNESLIKYTITSLSSKYLTFGAIGASSATDRCIKVSAICPS